MGKFAQTRPKPPIIDARSWKGVFPGNSQRNIGGSHAVSSVEADCGVWRGFDWECTCGRAY